VEAWTRIVLKAASDEDLAILAVTELSEKIRHLYNLALGVVALYLAVLALGVHGVYIHLIASAATAASIYRAKQWRELLTLVEEIISGDPPMGVRSWIDRNGDDLIFIGTAIALYLYGLLHSLGILP